MSPKRKRSASSGMVKKRIRTSNLIKISSRPTYSPSQPVVVFDLPASTYILSNAVTTGLIASAQPLDPSARITGWSTRFQNTFDEYRVVSILTEIIPLGIYTGVTAFYYSEESVGTPTFSEASERSALFIKNNEQAPVNRTMLWKASDFNDLTFRAISVGNTQCYFNVYTDNANLGTPVAAAQLVLIRCVFKIQFRALAST